MNPNLKEQQMENKICRIVFIAFATVIMFTFIACGPPRLKGTVSIDGEHLWGYELTANTASLGGSGIITYQWLRNGVTVDDIVGAIYKLQEIDNNAVITVTVIRSDNSGSVTSTPVTIYFPRLEGTVSIGVVENTLNANTASLDSSGTVFYQWMRNGDILDGMNAAQYTLQNIDRGFEITLTVTSAGNSGSVTSAPVIIHYLIGDTGPGGGIIFYRNIDGFTMADTGETAYYLEAAHVNQGTSLAWASSGFTNRNITGIGLAIGTGRRNTALILAVDADAPAARACANYNGGNKNDWFLASRGELNELYRQRRLFGISSGYFWSTSQPDNSGASVQDFTYGSFFYYNKGSRHPVRAIRAF